LTARWKKIKRKKRKKVEAHQSSQDRCRIQRRPSLADGEIMLMSQSASESHVKGGKEGRPDEERKNDKD
jgi:hypothetical protein